MKKPPKAQDERQRLNRLYSLELLDGGAEETIDAFTQLAAEMTGLPIALLSLIDADRQWIKSSVGLVSQGTETSRDVSFCGHAILHDEFFEVEDARLDDRFADNPMVVGEPFVIHYAGAPIVMPAGERIGSLCVVDHKPGRLSNNHRLMLLRLSKMLANVLLMRESDRLKTKAALDSARLAEELVQQRTAELSQARKEADQANHAKSEFLAAMSHEIRTPMSGVMGLIELVALGPLSDEQKSTLSLAHESGASLLHIVDDILDFSKIEANRLDMVPVAASVRSVVQRSLGLYAQSASRKNLALQAQITDQIAPALIFDPVRVGQILNNFLSNAIKFTNRGSVEVRVDLVARGAGFQHVRLQVQDTGVGMTPAQLGRLFQPFNQATAQVGATYGGTGLGLVICRRLAQLMGGTVEIQSEKGKGTTLTLSLQLPVCDAQAQEEDSTAEALDTLAALRAGRRCAPTVAQAEAERTLLLVADDHPTNRTLLLRQLASLGYAAEAVTDGLKALEAWQSGRFAALITDCNMPGMSGYELATKIRDHEQHRGQPRAPIVAFTANALQSARDMCMAAGMDDCLIKPANLTRVSQLLDRWVPVAGGKAENEPEAPASTSLRDKPTTQRIFDAALLAEISGGDHSVQSQILLDFQRVNDMDAAELRRAAASKQYEQVAHFAHRIQGASKMVGANVLAEVCAQVEDQAKNMHGRPDFQETLGHFEAELLRLNSHLSMLTES